MDFQIDLSPPVRRRAREAPVPALGAAEAAREMRRVQELYDRRSHLDRLSGEELAEMVAFQVSVEDLENRRHYFRTTPLEATFQGQVIPLLETLLRRDPSVRSVMNIGVRYAFADHALASRFPEVQFVGVDFPPNLREMNAELARPNLSFVSGYALDVLREGEMAPDVVFFSSTALTINNAELRHYVRTIARKARYIVFNEPLHHGPDGRLVDPLDLTLDGSVPVRVQPVAGKSAPLNIVHNYKAIVEDSGFRVLHYRVAPFPPFEPYLLQLVATRGVELEVDLRFPAVPALQRLRHGLRTLLARRLGLRYGPYAQTLALRERDRNGGDRDRLSPRELEEMVAFQVAVEDREYRRAHFRDTPLNLTIQGRAVPLVETLARRDRSIRSVLDVGVRYAFVDHFLAEILPDVEFVGVDFMPDLAEMNAELRRPNLRFEVGYALDLIEAGRLRPDLVLMVDTALTIRNAELRRYLAALARRARYVVVVDPLHRSPGGGLEDPLTLPAHASLPVYTPPVRITSRPGPLCYRHNYKALLEEAGYEVVHYKVFPLGHYDLNLLAVVGERRREG